MLRYFVCLLLPLAFGQTDLGQWQPPPGKASTSHGISGGVQVGKDRMTITLSNFNYKVGAPAAYFYLVSGIAKDAQVSNQTLESAGVRVSAKNSETLSVDHTGATLQLMAPSGKDVFEYSLLTIWCDDFSVEFARVPISEQSSSGSRLTALAGTMLAIVAVYFSL